jgi:glucosamine-6-phosphate deaminase
VTIEILDDHDAVTARVADSLTELVGRLRAPVLALPTGRTMEALYARLAGAPVPWTGVSTFNLDEFVGLSPTHPGSFRAFMDHHLFGRVPIPIDAIGFLRGDSADLDVECERYDAAMAAAGGFDVALLGLGANGHLGFNEPGDTLHADTHVVQLHDDTRRANAYRFGGDWRSVPERALTIGMGPVLRARQVWVVATGTTKASAVAAMCEGPLTTQCPASWLQVHGHARVVVDRAAAAGVRRVSRL